MAQAIRRAAVIGAGSMGSGIAAQFANGGVPVLLLDIATDGADRNALARAGVDRQIKAGGFMSDDAVALVEIGNLTDDLSRLADVDWVVEAIIEKLDIKRDLFAKLEQVCRPGTAISSNTSTIPLRQLVDGRSAQFRQDFVITHFFNPPRHMQLMELVPGEATATAALVRQAAERVLGKTVVLCRDTPGFIANRLGCFWMSVGLIEGQRCGLTPEEADAVGGAPFGVPRTGLFGLADLVGIDLVPPVWSSLLGALPADDPHQAYDLTKDALVARMIAEGRIGRKAKGGFYRMAPGTRDKETLDFASFAYRPTVDAKLPRDLKELLARDDGAGRYAWAVLSHVVTYAATVAAEIADDVAAIDVAMALGYGWQRGPFALADKVGVGVIVDRLRAEGRAVPDLLVRAAEAGGFYRKHNGVRQALGTVAGWHVPARADGVLDLAEIKEQGPRIAGNDSASLWDIGDGVACLEFHTKMNAIDIGIIEMIEQVVDLVPAKGLRALVLHNTDPRAFSAGANLDYFMRQVDAGDFAALDAFIARGQVAFKGLKFAPFPVVAAPAGLALGGGCEVTLHCDAIQAHAELTMGLVEVKVGIIPGWRGCVELLLRWAQRADRPGGPMKASQAAFEVIAGAKMSGSAAQARAMGFLRPNDGITMMRDHLLGDAKAKALALVPGYQPPPVGEIALAGLSGATSLDLQIQSWCRAGMATAHDDVVLTNLARVLTGASADQLVPVDEETLAGLEREALAALCRHPASQDRVRHMMQTGKPLRN